MVPKSVRFNQNLPLSRLCLIEQVVGTPGCFCYTVLLMGNNCLSSSSCQKGNTLIHHKFSDTDPFQ